MDNRRFDNLTRNMASTSSRRLLLRGLAGIAGGLAGLGGTRALSQTCRGGGRLCAQNGNCCSGICDTTNPDPTKRNRCVPPCVPDDPTVTCNQRCGTVANNCGQPVDCDALFGGCDASQCLICNPSQTGCVSSCTPPATCGGGGVPGFCGTPGQGTCPTGADFCSGPVVSCDGLSFCLCSKKLDGTTFCGRNGVCHDCTSDADCVPVQGPGSICADTSGPGCNCPRACQPPCRT